MSGVTISSYFPFRRVKIIKRVCDKFMGNNFMPPPDAPKNLPIGC